MVLRKSISKYLNCFLFYRLLNFRFCFQVVYSEHVLFHCEVPTFCFQFVYLGKILMLVLGFIS